MALRSGFRGGLAVLLLLVQARCWGQPDNDLFKNRIESVGPRIALEAYLLGASMEPGEPNHSADGTVTIKSAWWSWTSPYSGYAVAISQSDLLCDPGVAVYTGTSLQNLSRVREVSPGVVPVEAGHRYFIALWSQCPSPTPDLARFVIQSVLGVGRDLFEPGGGYLGDAWTGWGRTIGLSGPEEGEPSHAGIGRGPSEWFDWTLTRDGQATVFLQGHQFVPVLAAYLGDHFQELVPVSQRLTESLWMWPAQQGRTYRVAVAGVEAESAGVYEIQAALSQITIAVPSPGTLILSPETLPVLLAGAPATGVATVWWRHARGLSASVTGPASAPLVLPAPPRGPVSVFATVLSSNLTYATPEVVIQVETPGDLMGEPVVVVGPRFQVSGDLGGATVEDGELSVGGDQPASIWWQWTSPDDGIAYFEVSGAPQFLAFAEEPDGTLSAVAADPLPDDPRLRQLSVAHGTTFRFRAADPFGQARTVNFRLRMIGPPPNDDRTNATVLTPDGASIQGSNFFATVESGEAFAHLGKSVWYQLTSPINGVWSYELEHGVPVSSIRYPEALLFAQLPTGGLEFVQRLTVFGRGLFSMDAGVTHWLAVYGPASSPLDDFTLHWRPEVSAANDRYENATGVMGSPARWAGDLRQATINAHESTAGLWWRWRAPRSGTATLVFSGTPEQLYALATPVFRLPVEADSRPINHPGGNRSDPTVLDWLPYGKAGTTFPVEEGVDYDILIQGKYPGTPVPFQAELDLTSARVQLTGTQSPFAVELEDFDPAIETPTDGVGYGLGPEFMTGSGSPPFQANVPLEPYRQISVLAYLTNQAGGIRVLRSPTISISPLNDEPEGAVNLERWSPHISDNGEGATYSGADLAHTRLEYSDRGGGSLWFRWAAPVTGSVRIQGPGGYLAPQLFVNGRRLFDPRQELREGTLRVQEGREYLMAVVGPSQTSGPFDFGLGFSYSIQFLFPPITNAVIELVAPGADLTVVDGSTVHLQAKLLYEPPAFSGLVFYLATNWRRETISTEAEGIHHLLKDPGIYSVSAAALRGDGSIAQETPARAIHVVPRNDHFANRAAWPLNTEIDAKAATATLEPGEPSLTGATDGRSIWWTWHAPESGEAELVVSQPSSAQFRSAVYRGSRLDSLLRVSTTETQDQTSTQRLRFPMVGGEDYSIAYEEAGYGSGAHLRIVARAVPANDQRKMALPITENPAIIEAWNVGATRELGEPHHGDVFGGRSVWYRWHAPADGQLHLTLGAMFEGSILAVYIADDLSGTGPLLPGGGASHQAGWSGRVQGGTDYDVAVDGAWGVSGDFRLELAFEAIPSTLEISRVAVANGFLEIDASGAADRKVVLWTSNDLKSWTVRPAAQPDSDGIARFRLPREELDPVQFFRVSVDDQP